TDVDQVGAERQVGTVLLDDAEWQNARVLRFLQRLLEIAGRQFLPFHREGLRSGRRCDAENYRQPCLGHVFILVSELCGGIIPRAKALAGHGSLVLIRCFRGGIDAARRKAMRRGAETILVLEDEEAVRKLVVAVLAQQGYRVLEAASPEEAL